MNAARWNPYFAAYANAQGTAPEATAAGAAFIVWISQQWVEWEAATGLVRRYDGDAFGSWLADRWPAPAPLTLFDVEDDAA